MLKRVASGGVAATPLPERLVKPTLKSDELSDEEKEKRRREMEATLLQKAEENATQVASADGKNWASRIKPEVEKKYIEERSKGKRNIPNAERIANILDMLDKEEKAPELMSDRLDKMVRPKRKKDDEDETEE